MEQVDLTLIKQYVDPYNTPKVQNVMSKDIVLPILDSITSSNGCSLKFILLPYNWEVHSFGDRYNQMLDNRGISCSNCEIAIQGNQWYNTENMYHYNTCYDCLKHYCSDCTNREEDGGDTDADGDNYLSSCDSCKKDYCKDCDSTVQESCIPCSGCRGGRDTYK